MFFHREHYLSTVTWASDERIAVQWQKRTQNYVVLKTYDFSGNAWKESSLVHLTSWTIVESLNRLKHNLHPIVNLFFLMFFFSFLQSQVITSSTGWVGRVWIIWWQSYQLMFNAMLIQANMSACWFVCPAFVVFSWWTCLSAGQQQLLLHYEWWEAI